MYSEKVFEESVALLRIALGIIFFWFGALKLAGFNPVYDIVYASFPFLADGVGNLFLGGFEALIGLALISNAFAKTTHLILIFHLLGTFTVFITAPEIMFDPQFPFLTLAGEFVVKNLSLAMGGIVVILYHMRHPRLSKGWI
ncbi:MAG: hypothetical protein A2849_00005 [Candidatus Taylorbacteria bacterium RIFCSPHIGHO2_01_FULL_51_15]|uniref:DoxX family protein n=1 Tax=Candidatus Taylorbacteria bacterium RIFCSPHIGHO2_01_FULL_51_15 TaxID=1802304 RepID=A0A1G2MBU5_9BACT|nr:MAG: hypothetical protein A2849_00005 [Candidatus Taylorbacteria bacterium RIFCSPHIGHO2_01_FULL_51_15]